MSTDLMNLAVIGMDPNEEWKPIDGFSGYEVSNFGQVRSFRPKNGRGGLTETPRLLKQGFGKGKQYYRVGLINEGCVTYFPVHKLVLTAFRGPRPSPDFDACHNDGNARNNRLTNLRWDTRQANADDRVAHGAQVRGEQVGLAVLTEDQVQEIKAAIPIWRKGMGQYFSRKFGVGSSAISAIKNGQTWRHVCPNLK